MQITTIGLDIAKNVFQVHGIDAAEKVVVRKRLRRSQVIDANSRKISPAGLTVRGSCSPNAGPVCQGYADCIGSGIDGGRTPGRNEEGLREPGEGGKRPDPWPRSRPGGKGSASASRPDGQAQVVITCSRSAVAPTRRRGRVLQVLNSLGCASRHTMAGASAASA